MVQLTRLGIKVLDCAIIVQRRNLRYFLWEDCNGCAFFRFKKECNLYKDIIIHYKNILFKKLTQLCNFIPCAYGNLYDKAKITPSPYI